MSSKNFDLLVSNAKTDDAERNLYHRWVNSRKVDGFILNRIRRHDWRVNFLSQWGIPFVALGRSQDGIEYPYVRIEAADEYLDLVKHVRKNGFSQFAFIWYGYGYGLRVMSYESDSNCWVKLITHNS